jgi:hypothetical protein
MSRSLQLVAACVATCLAGVAVWAGLAGSSAGSPPQASVRPFAPNDGKARPMSQAPNRNLAPRAGAMSMHVTNNRILRPAGQKHTFYGRAVVVYGWLREEFGLRAVLVGRAGL